MCDCDSERGEFFLEDFESARRVVTTALLFQRDGDYVAVGQVVDGALDDLSPSSVERRERFLTMMMSLVVVKLAELTDDEAAAKLRSWLLEESISNV